MNLYDIAKRLRPGERFELTGETDCVCMTVERRIAPTHVCRVTRRLSVHMMQAAIADLAQVEIDSMLVELRAAVKAGVG